MLASPVFDIAIVGGGAAGLAAAVLAARESKGRYSVAIFEKAPRVGRKLLATGNGTCNLSNSNATASHYHGIQSSFVKPALKAFCSESVCHFFESIGVECCNRETGRIYPLCAKAGAVLDCLRLETQSLGVQEICGSAVSKISQNKNEFILHTVQGKVKARRVLICTGGAASPALGGSAEAYALLTTLGHTRMLLFPSIVQVKTDTKFVKAVKGIRVQALVAFELNGRRIAQEKGEVLFTEYGISGPAVMQISRCVSDWERRRKGSMTAVLNLLPDMDNKQLTASLQRRVAMHGRTMGDLLTGLLQKRLGQTVLRASGYTSLSENVSVLCEHDLSRIAEGIVNWKIPVTGTQGMGGAQVTAGGISTAEFNSQTMESRLVPGIYAAGEVLDIDGDCGGFNLQWAWSSAYAAAVAMVQSLNSKKDEIK